MYSDEGNKKDLNFQFANIIGLLGLKIKLHLVSANRRLFLSPLDAPNHPRPLRKATSGEMTVLKTALPPPVPHSWLCTFQSPVLVRQASGMVNSRHTPSVAIVHWERWEAPNPSSSERANSGACACLDIKVEQTGPADPASPPTYPATAIWRSFSKQVVTFSLSPHTSKFPPHTNWVHRFKSSCSTVDTRTLCLALILCFPK